MREITKYLNFIKKVPRFSQTSFKYEMEFEFRGDGAGDFEQYERSATTEVLKDYIDQCKEQIKLAEEALELKN